MKMKAHPTVKWFRAAKATRPTHAMDKFERRVYSKKCESECLDAEINARNAKTRVAELREKGLLK